MNGACLHGITNYWNLKYRPPPSLEGLDPILQYYRYIISIMIDVDKDKIISLSI